MKERYFPYHRTNESIPAILNGLDPHQGDVILAIAGSGDQSFAMLSRGASQIFAVDRNWLQLRYMQKQMRRLSRGLYLEFLNQRPSRYEQSFRRKTLDEALNVEALNLTGFFDEQIMEKIGRSVSKIRLIHSELTEAAKRFEGWNKVYLSNALDERWCGSTRKAIDNLSPVVNRLPRGGVVYIAEFFPMFSEGQRINGLVVDEERTLSAQKNTHFAGGIPVVYRKE